jgi:hypothetical protein
MFQWPRGNTVVPTFELVYLAGWVVTTAVTYVASRRLADGPTTPRSSLCFSLLAGLLWPLMVIGVVELSSLVVYAAAKAWRRHPDVPDYWLRADAFDNVVVPLR